MDGWAGIKTRNRIQRDKKIETKKKRSSHASVMEMGARETPNNQERLKEAPVPFLASSWVRMILIGSNFAFRSVPGFFPRWNEDVSLLKKK